MGISVTSHAEEIQEPLRVAIVSDSERQRGSLSDILKACGLSVIIKESMTADAIKAITRHEADVLLVDLDDNIDHDLEFLDGIMEAAIPVLFNDSAATRLGAAHTQGEWGRNLAKKLGSIAEPNLHTDSVASPASTPDLTEETEEQTAASLKADAQPSDDKVLESAADYIPELSDNVEADLPQAKPETLAKDFVLSSSDSALEASIAAFSSSDELDDIDDEADTTDEILSIQAEDVTPVEDISDLDSATAMDANTAETAFDEPEETVPAQPQQAASQVQRSSIDSIRFRRLAEKPRLKPGAARNVWTIGSSIGGPQAVKDFLSNLDAELDVAFVMAQHIGASFVSLLSKQLDRISKFKVMPAEDGHVLKHGEVVITPVDMRVVVNPSGVIELKPMITKSVYTPSIDEVITDIAIRYGVHSGAIIFSGMGSDGVRGCQVMAARGAPVWAQEPETCVISSMPDSTRRAGIVSTSGTPAELAMRINETCSSLQQEALHE